MTNTSSSSHNLKISYWKANLSITLKLLLVWFFASFGCGILFKEYLDQFSIGGAPLGFLDGTTGVNSLFRSFVDHLFVPDE